MTNKRFFFIQQFNETEAMLMALPVGKRKERNLSNLKNMQKIRGHLVPYPVDFLKNEKLDSGTTIEKILPPKVFQ